MKHPISLTAITSLLVLGSALTMSSLVYAGDAVDINVTGTIVASPCKVSDETKNMGAISLGDTLQSSDFGDAGSASTWVPFTVKLDNCPSGTTKVTATFTGTADPENAQLYLNNGTATNVGVELQDATGTELNSGETSDLTIAADHTAVWSLKTRAFSTKGGATPGDINSTITMSFVYN